MSYGAEVWGLTKNQEILERVHLFAIKRFLGVHSKTPRYLVYGDSGRYPVFIISYCKCIKFWLKIVRMNSSRLVHKAYHMLLYLQMQNYKTWIDQVKNVLFMYGFGYVWEAQGVGSEALFLKCFKERLIDCNKQNWHASLESNDIFCTCYIKRILYPSLIRT